MKQIIMGRYAFNDWAEKELSHREDHANCNWSDPVIASMAGFMGGAAWKDTRNNTQVAPDEFWGPSQDSISGKRLKPNAPSRYQVRPSPTKFPSDRKSLSTGKSPKVTKSAASRVTPVICFAALIFLGSLLAGLIYEQGLKKADLSSEVNCEGNECWGVGP